MTSEMIAALFVGNPMLIEIRRFRRKYLTFSSANAANNVTLALILVCYLGFTMIVTSTRYDVPPIALVMIQTVLGAILAPTILHGAIAGEREKRSWDLLLVAPISQAQLIAGKFMGAFCCLLIGVAMFGLPTLICAFSYDHTNWLALGLSEAISIALISFICALTMFFSARVKRPFIALGTTLGCLVVAYILVPIMAGAGAYRGTDTWVMLHPLIAIGQLAQVGQSNYGSQDLWWIDSAPLIGFTHIIVNLFLTVVFLVWAERTLRFADNEVKFLPKSKNQA